MCDELKVLIQWPNGSILPVLTNKNSKGSELIKLLRFAYSSKEEILLFHNGIHINLDNTLGNQFIKENSVIEAFFTPKSQNSEQLDPNIQSIFLEAAKLSDRRYNVLETRPYCIQSTEENTESEEDYYTDYYDYDTKEDLEKEKVGSIPSDPLPIFWEENEDSEQFSLSRSQVQSNFSSIEDVGQFLENRDWPYFM